MEDRFKFRWFDKTIDFMAKVKSLNIEDDYAIVEYSYAESETPDEEVKLSTGVLMQCTGLKDKNGKLIYGGDILDSQKYCDAKCKVVYKVEFACWYCINLYTHSMKRFANPDIDLDELKIIGNIYENKKLLTNNEE